MTCWGGGGELEGVEGLQLRVPPQGLEVAEWEASEVWSPNLLALELSLGRSGRRLLFWPAGCVQHSVVVVGGGGGGGVVGGWAEQRICRLGTICLLPGGFGTSLFGCVDT